MRRPSSSGTTHEEMERLLGMALRIGVAVAGTLVLAGAMLLLRQHGGIAVGYRAFRGEPTDLRAPGGIWRAAIDLQPRGIIQLGLLVLIATPVARVALAALAFARQRDRLYTVVAVVVLVALMLGLRG